MLQNLEKFVSNAKCIQSEALEYDKLSYTNIVSTVKLLPPGYSFSLESIISHKYMGFIKCDPKSFCGITIKITDSIGATTHNLFRSGILNTMGAKTIEHARYSAQIIRQYLASIKGAYIGPNNKIIYTNLIKNTVFFQCKTVLMTALYDLGKKPNLVYISKIAQEISRWDPDRFPGLMFLAWLSPRNKCNCIKTKKKANCKCTIRFIIYDTGKIVISGGKTISIINRAIKILRELFLDEDFITDEKYQSIRNRSKYRREDILKNCIQFNGFTENDITKPKFNVLSLVPAKKKTRK